MRVMLCGIADGMTFKLNCLYTLTKAGAVMGCKAWRTHVSVNGDFNS